MKSSVMSRGSAVEGIMMAEDSDDDWDSPPPRSEAIEMRSSGVSWESALERAKVAEEESDEDVRF